jgi:hypothetical protein
MYAVPKLKSGNILDNIMYGVGYCGIDLNDGPSITHITAILLVRSRTLVVVGFAA